MPYADFLSFASFAHSLAHFRQASPQREKASILALLLAGVGELVAGACTDVAERIGVLRTALKQLSCEGRDARAITCCRHDRRDQVDIRLRESGRYQTLTTSSCDVTRF